MSLQAVRIFAGAVPSPKLALPTMYAAAGGPIMKSENNHYKNVRSDVGSNPIPADGTHESAGVEVKATVEGWVFTCGDRVAGPFKTLGETQPLHVAASLSGVPEAKLRRLEALIERSVELERLGQPAAASVLEGEWRDEVGGWPVRPKDVFRAQLAEHAGKEPERIRRVEPRDFPVFPPSLMATCFKRRFRDVGDCGDFGCQYWFWCIRQLETIGEGATLLLYERDPTKCAICRWRMAGHLFIVERGSKAPNSLFVTCRACAAKTPRHWKVLKEEELELDY